MFVLEGERVLVFHLFFRK